MFSRNAFSDKISSSLSSKLQNHKESPVVAGDASSNSAARFGFKPKQGHLQNLYSTPLTRRLQGMSPLARSVVGNEGVGFTPIQHDHKKAGKLLEVLYSTPDTGIWVRECQKIWPELTCQFSYMVECMEYQSMHFTMSDKCPDILNTIGGYLTNPDEFVADYKARKEQAIRHGLGGWNLTDGREYIRNETDWLGPESWWDQRHWAFIYNDLRPDDLSTSLIRNEVDEELLGEFKRTLREILSKNDIDDQWDFSPDPAIGLFPRGTQSYDKSQKGMKSRHYLSKMRKGRTEYSTKLEGLECWAAKFPGEIRHTVETSPETIATIAMLNQCIVKVVNTCFPTSPTGKDREEVERILDGLFQPHLYWYARDIRKCGLTMPLELTHAVLDVLYEETKCIWFKYGRSLFEKPILIREDGTRQEVQRGTFLGYFNDGITIIEYVINLMVKRACNKRVLFSAFNDDTIAASKSLESISIYAQKDLEICHLLGIEVHGSKSFISCHGTFYLEEYYYDYKHLTKDFLTCLALKKAKYCKDIREAKEMVNSLSPLITGRHGRAALVETISHFGYEFDQWEASRPYIFGGWTTPLLNGIDNSFGVADWSDYALAAYHAVHAKVKGPSEVEESATTPLGYMFGVRGKASPAPFSVMFTPWLFMGTEKTIGWIFHRSETGRDRSEVIGNRIWESRRKTYLNVLENVHEYSWELCYNEWLRNTQGMPLARFHNHIELDLVEEATYKRVRTSVSGKIIRDLRDQQLVFEIPEDVHEMVDSYLPCVPKYIFRRGDKSLNPKSRFYPAFVLAYEAGLTLELPDLIWDYEQDFYQAAGFYVTRYYEMCPPEVRDSKEEAIRYGEILRDLFLEMAAPEEEPAAPDEPEPQAPPNSFQFAPTALGDFVFLPCIAITRSEGGHAERLERRVITISRYVTYSQALYTVATMGYKIDPHYANSVTGFIEEPSSPSNSDLGSEISFGALGEWG